MQRVLTVFGTRPEAIKMAPVVRALKAQDGVEPIVCVTGQHRQMLDQMLDFFQIEAAHDLDVMRPNQTLPGLTAATLDSLQKVMEAQRPDWVVMQGDTTTAMASALSAFYNKVRIAHVEAGLRTHDKYAPYPEEVNRRVIGTVADLHFAPTETARQALLAEGERPETIIVTGNTGIDSLFWTVGQARAGRVRPPADLEEVIRDRRLVLVTAHRRESFDGGLVEICAALRSLAEQVLDIVVVLPVHPNPNVKGPIEAELSGVDRILLTPPIDYGPFVWLLDRAHLVLTDSGGIQEEATALGKPMLVMRDVTERPEALATGNAKLVGARRERIVAAALKLLTDPSAYAAMAKASDAFGDGGAGPRIAAAIAERCA